MDLAGLVKSKPVVAEVASVSALRRDYDASRLNPIANHPEVRPWIGPGHHDIDASKIVEDLRNVLLMTDHGGLLFHQLEPCTYEVHTNFLPSLRGAQAVSVCREALHWMFVRTDCLSVVTKVPDHNKGALGMVRAVRMNHEFDRAAAWETDEGPVGVGYFALRYWDWIKTAWSLEEKGKWFHDRLAADKARLGHVSAPILSEPACDRVAGAAVEQLFAGQVDKAILLYNHWARFAGYKLISLLSFTPLVIDIGDAIVAIGRDDVEVIRCHLPQQS